MKDSFGEHDGSWCNDNVGAKEEGIRYEEHWEEGTWREENKEESEEVLDEAFQDLLDSTQELYDSLTSLEVESNKHLRNISIGITACATFFAGVSGYMVTKDPTYTGAAFLSGACLMTAGVGVIQSIDANQKYKKSLQKRKTLEMIKHFEREL